MPITGNDEKSLQILASLEKGTKLKDIPSMYSVSLDQAKRLSRYFNMLEKAKMHLHESTTEKLLMIGLKILYLSPLFKYEDWEGLTEILSSINENTKRDKLALLIKALQEKRQRISEFQQDIDRKLTYLNKREQELQLLEEKIKETQLRIKEEITFLNKYPEAAQLFLIKHLGIYNDKLVLARRLDSLWQKALKKKDILYYSDWEFIWYVKDLDGMVSDYLKRTNRKVPLGTEWDYGKEEHRSRNSDYYPPENPEYRLPQGLATDLCSFIEDVEKKMITINDERKTIQKEIRELKKTSPQSFIEAIEATNTLSAHELRLHGELQDKALKWLYSKGYIVAGEITLPNGKRADVIGYDKNGHIIIVEVKVSAADFRQDEKWESYLDYCDEFYFLPNEKAYQVYNQKQYIGAGLLKANKSNISVVKTHTLEHKAKEREKIHFSISKTLSRKYVYGY